MAHNVATGRRRTRPERDFVATLRDLPDPGGSLYLESSIRANAGMGGDGSEDHVITGVRVVIGGSEDVNRLHDQYHRSTRIRSLTICADELVIHGQLHMPQTNVRIFARRLVFEDEPGDPGCLTTSPLPFDKPGADDGHNGEPGKKAGDVEVYVHEFVDPIVRPDRQEGSAPAVPRFDLHGGGGQDAGAGRNGSPGTDVDSAFPSFDQPFDYPLFGTWHAVHTFSGPPATYLDFELRSGGMGGVHTHYHIGDYKLVPTNGTDAAPPGRPGNGGDGGTFRGVRVPRAAVDTLGGSAGKKAADCFGGSAGRPEESAQYYIIAWDRAFAGPIKINTERIRSRTTTRPGANAPAPAADKQIGEPGEAIMYADEVYANAWAHPLLAQAVLLYARDAYLMCPSRIHELVPVLEAYENALRGPVPEQMTETGTQTGSVLGAASSGPAQLDFATLLHRIRSGLDCFGNPAGWTPLFSLPVLLRLSKHELEQSMQMLVLARWLRKRADKADEAQSVAGQATEALRADVAEAVEQISQRTSDVHELERRAEELQKKINDYRVRLAWKRTELEDKAREQASDAAWIKLGTSVLSGVLQVIPYGQPILGTLGSAAPGIADAILDGSDDGTLAGDLATQLATTLGKISEAKLSERATDIVRAAKPADQRDRTAEQAEDTAKLLTDIGSAVGPALTGIATSIQGLSVPETEVKARLSGLEAQSDEFKDLVAELTDLNSEKTDFVARLAEALQAVATANARITSDLSTMAALQRQRRENLRVLDHDARLRVRAMDQAARATVAKYLYYVAKAYEYATLEPCDADYRLDALFDKIADLAEKDTEADDSGLVSSRLMGLFLEELQEVRRRLVDRFTMEYTESLEMRISTDQSPRIMRSLNDTGEAVVNLRRFNKITPSWQRITIDDIEIAFEFDASASLPAEGTVRVTVEPLGDGTLRARVGDRDNLFAVRHPIVMSGPGAGEHGLVWGKTHHFGRGEDDVLRPSRQSLDLLNALIGDGDTAIRSTIAAPAAWTDLRIRYTSFSKSRPRLASILLKLHLNYRNAHADHRTVDVRMVGGCEVDVGCSPADLNGRDDGVGEIYRIYEKGTDIQLSVPVTYGARTFAYWDVIDTRTMASQREQETVLRIRAIEHDVRVYCHYRPAETAAVVGPARQWFAPGRAMFTEPGGPAIDYLPAGAEPTVLESTARPDGTGWQKVDYHGSVGWVTSDP